MVRKVSYYLDVKIEVKFQTNIELNEITSLANLLFFLFSLHPRNKVK